MNKLLLYLPDDRGFDLESVEQVIESESGFSEVRFNEPGGALLEAIYEAGEDRTIVRLNSSGETISLSGQSDAAILAAILFQKRLQGPIHIIDLDYAFDLVLADYPTLDELRSAIESAQAS